MTSCAGTNTIAALLAGAAVGTYGEQIWAMAVPAIKLAIGG